MSVFRPKKEIEPLPYPCYYFPVLIIGLIGLLDSVYLVSSHFRLFTDMGYQSFCAISRAINCDTVSQSKYSILFGVPVPVWGFVGYAVYLTILAFAWYGKGNNARVWTLLMSISLFFSLYSLVLAGISTFIIHSYCIMCILSYAVNFMLLYFSWLVRKRYKSEGFLSAIRLDVKYIAGFPKAAFLMSLFFSAGVLSMLFYFPPYWKLAPPMLSKDIPSGLTEEGYPWIGAENPELEIVEFADYQCFQCKKMHSFLRGIVQSRPSKIRLIHRHFPMDHKINPLVDKPFHSGAAKLAILSIFAAERGKFWEMNDLIFNETHQTDVLDIRFFAEKTGLDPEELGKALRDFRLWVKLRKDILDGMRKGLTGTPGFIIDGKVYIGHIPPEVLARYVEN